MRDLLEIDALSAGYGDAVVLRNVSLGVPPGSVCAIVGNNGAGKTTLFRSIIGLVPLTGGGIRLDGERIEKLETHRRVAQGVALVPEGRLVFSAMSVEENLLTGAITPRAADKREGSLDEIYQLFPLLGARRRQLAGTLSGGEQQMLAIGRGLMGSPRLLLLDEPTLGLAPAVASQVFELVPTIVALGVTVIIAEQDVRRTLALSDRAYVIENGQVCLEGSGQELLDDPAVRVAYLGL